MLDPVDPQNGKSASELLRKQRKKPVRRKKRIASDAESEGELDFDEDGEPIVKTKTKEKKKRQKKREEEEAAYKSAQFVSLHAYEARWKVIHSPVILQIHDSDEEEDAERDAAFFANEAAVRFRHSRKNVEGPQSIIILTSLAFYSCEKSYRRR